MSELKKTSHTADVCVIGGGLAGTFAAIAAARHGAHVVLMQDRPVLGGNASSEIRMWVSGAGTRVRNLQETGIMEEFLLENMHINPSRNFSVWDSIFFGKVKAEKNIELMLNCACCAAECHDGKIESVTGFQLTTYTWRTVKAKIFIDCSGDSILAELADAEYMVGREAKSQFGEEFGLPEADRKTMGMSLMIQAHETDHPCPFTAPDWAYRYNTDEEMKFKPHECLDKINTNFYWIELGGEADSIHDTETTRDELLKIAFGVWDHMKNRGDHGAENYRLEWVGALPGMRESRRLMGDYILTESDILDHKIFDDAVCYGGWCVDLHAPHGLLDFDILPSDCHHFTGVYTIPYRSYYSKNIDNLMMAGRDISTTKLGLASTRIIGCCAIGGQAVGTAAALCRKYDCDPRALAPHIKELQQLIMKDDGFLPGFKNEDKNDKALGAEFCASSNIEGGEPINVSNGISRKLGASLNAWVSDGISEIFALLAANSLF